MHDVGLQRSVNNLWIIWNDDDNSMYTPLETGLLSLVCFFSCSKTCGSLKYMKRKIIILVFFFLAVQRHILSICKQLN